MSEPIDPVSGPIRIGFEDESLADVLPSPVNDDRLPYLNTALNTALGGLSIFVAAGGAFLLIAGAMTPCMGATRSTKLQWERRQLLMDQAEQAMAQADLSNDEQPSIVEHN